MDNWEKAKKIFADAIKFAPAERLRFLDEVCADAHDGKFIIGADVLGGRWNLAEITVCSIDGESCRQVTRGYSPHWSHDDSQIYYNHFSNLKDGEELWKVSNDGGDAKKIMDLQPLHPIGNFFDVSPQGEIVWMQYQRGKHELWLAEFPAS